MENNDPMDDLTKRRISNEISEVADIALDMVEIVREINEHDLSSSMAHALHLGLRRDALEKGLLTPISQMLGNLSGRLWSRGLDRDAISQVLFGVWQGRETITELAEIDPEVSAQTRRCLDWALDEIVVLCDFRQQAPTVAWFLITMGLDVIEAVAVPSKV